MKTTMTMLLLATMVATAPADALADNTCPPSGPVTAKPAAPKKHRHKKKVPAKPTVEVITPVCACVDSEEGPRGPRGYAGVPGRDGRDGQITVVHKQDTIAFPLDVGVFGTTMVDTNAWAWGPALQVGGSVAEHYDLTLSLGLALGAGDNQAGYQLRLGANRDLDTVEKVKVQLTAGVNYLKIDDSNKQYGAEFVFGDLGIALARKVGPVNLRLNYSPIVLSGYANSVSSDKHFDFGMTGSLFGSVKW